MSFNYFAEIETYRLDLTRPTDLYRARKGKRPLSRNRISRRNLCIAPY